MKLTPNNTLALASIKLGDKVVLMTDKINVSEDWLDHFTGPIVKLDNLNKVIEIDFKSPVNRNLKYETLGLDATSSHDAMWRLVTPEIARQFVSKTPLMAISFEPLTSDRHPEIVFTE